MLTDVTSIVVLQHETWQCTRDLVQGLVRHTDVPYELVLVDNGSSDPLAIKYAESLRDKDFVNWVLRLPVNKGFAAAVNEALFHCEGEYICLLNNDCHVYEPWLGKLVAACKADPNIGMVSAMTTARQQLVHWQRWTEYPAGSVVDVVAEANLPMIPMTCVVIPARVIEQIGNLDPMFFVYGEDDDFCMRLKLAGLKLCVHTGVTVKHLHMQTTKLLKIDLEVHKARARSLLTERYGESWKSV